MSSSLQGMINIEEEIKLLENAAENAVKEGEKEAVEKKRLDAENKRYVWSSVMRVGSDTFGDPIFQKGLQN